MLPHHQGGCSLPAAPSRLWCWLLVASLLTQADLFIGASVEEMGNQSKARLRDTRANPIGPHQLIERGVHRPLVHEPLDLVQLRLALLVVSLCRLLLVQLIDVGVANPGKFSPTQY